MGVLDELEWATRGHSQDADPTVITEPGLGQCHGMAALLRELRCKFASPERSSLDDMHDERALHMLRTHPATLSRSAALHATDDGEERLFACAAPMRRRGLLARLFGQ